MLVLLLPVLSLDAVALNSRCVLHRNAGRQCDGLHDDTAALQHALVRCSTERRGVEVPAGANCTVGPITLPSHSALRVTGNLQALPRAAWPIPPNKQHVPDMIVSISTTNITITGTGTIDGRGHEWYPGAWYKPEDPGNRPKMLSLGNSSNVLLEGVTMLNAASFHIDIGDCGAMSDGGLPNHGMERCGVCENYTLRYLTIRSPNFEKARNTDGIDIAARNVHVHDCDVSNGDDSLCIKSPASNVLIENSTVRQGNGLVIGTSSDAAIENIIFRNIMADDTTFGCHIKFKPDQAGFVRGVLFENVSVYQSERAYLRRVVDPDDHAGYAIGIHQDDQGLHEASAQSKQQQLDPSGMAKPPPPPDPGKGVHVT